MSNYLIAQNYYSNLESQTLNNLESFNEKKQHIFQQIVKNRYDYNLSRRADTIKANYIFIEEKYCLYGSSMELLEIYFIAGDSFPTFIYEDGKRLNEEQLMYRGLDTTKYSLINLLERYSKLKRIQQAPYDKIQICHHGCIVFPDLKRKFRPRRKKELKSTYQIQSFIDYKNQNSFVSVQYPSRHIKFKIQLESGLLQ